MSSQHREQIAQFFGFAHLPPELRAVSEPFGVLAQHIIDTLPRNAERTVALRKLLESKDAAVRAKLSRDLEPLGAPILDGTANNVTRELGESER